MKKTNYIVSFVFICFLSSLFSPVIASEFFWTGMDNENSGNLESINNYDRLEIPGADDVVYITYTQFPPSHGTSSAGTIINKYKIIGGSYLGKISNQENSTVSGTINNQETIVFNNESTNHAQIYGPSEFNGNSKNDTMGYLHGISKFNVNSLNFGTIANEVEFNGNSINMTSGNILSGAKFNSQSINKGNILGNVEFNAMAINDVLSKIIGNSFFNDTTINKGEIVGLATFNSSSTNDITGIIDGDAEFNDYGLNFGIITGDSTINNPDYFYGSTTESLSISLFSPSNITRNSAILNGQTSKNALQAGFRYGTDENYAIEKLTSSLDDNGNYNIKIDGLACNKTYHFIGFAKNDQETATTSDSFFKTSACLRGRRNIDTTTDEKVDIIENIIENFSSSTPQVLIEEISTTSNYIIEEIPKTYTFNKNLSYRNEDTDVRELQKILNTFGYKLAEDGYGSPNNETTYFGPRTLKALIRFQKDNNITPTGYFGNITRETINKINQTSVETKTDQG